MATPGRTSTGPRLALTFLVLAFFLSALVHANPRQGRYPARYDRRQDASASPDATPGLDAAPGPSAVPSSAAATNSDLAGAPKAGQDDPATPGDLRFPKADDKFHFIPCTNKTSRLPSLDDTAAEKTWASQFDSNQDNWLWGPPPDRDAPTATGGRGVFLCGYLDVPADYTNQSDRRIVRLAVNMYQVGGPRNKASRTIVYNPGGPGDSGVQIVFLGGPDMARDMGANKLDILSFDPRGVSASLPGASCFANKAGPSFDVITKRFLEDSPAPRNQLEIVDAFNDALFESCGRLIGDFPRFMSTTSVARDMEQIRQALKEPELTAYMVSYGTALAETYMAMFPDVTGRVVLDGVEYAMTYRAMGTFSSSANDDITAAFNTGFLGECVAAGPERCELAKPVGDGQPVTQESLQKRIDTLFKSLQERPASALLEGPGVPTLVTFSEVAEALYNGLYIPRSWPNLARALALLEAGDATEADVIFRGIDRANDEDSGRPRPLAPAVPSTTEAFTLVVCTDSSDVPVPPNLDFWEQLWRSISAAVAPVGGSNFFGSFPCQNYAKHWGQAADLFRGPLAVQLKTPVLIVSQTFDPATPLRHGREIKADLGNSGRLIVHDGYGHSSNADPSKCTIKLIRDYFVDGVVPAEQETACKADSKPYDKKKGPDGQPSRRATESTTHEEHVRDYLEILRTQRAWMKPAWR